MARAEDDMLIGDWIRSMDDMALAQFLDVLISNCYQSISEKLTEQGVLNCLIEAPVFGVAHTLKFLKSPVEEYFEFEEEPDGGDV